MKYLLFLIVVILFEGCSIKSKSYYMLEGDKTIVAVHKSIRSVGVEKIELPRYFSQNDLAIKQGKNRVFFIQNAQWISDMDEHLTQILISYLKRYFNTTDIYYYPWEVKKKIYKIVHIRIDDFIYENGSVILDASWEIKSNSKSEAKFFKTSIKAKNSSDEIVKAMDKAFGRLEKQIAMSLE